MQSKLKNRLTPEELESMAKRHAVGDHRTYIKDTAAHADRGRLLIHIGELLHEIDPDNNFTGITALRLLDL